MSPVLEGGFLSTGPPGKSHPYPFLTGSLWGHLFVTSQDGVGLIQAPPPSPYDGGRPPASSLDMVKTC